MEPLEDVKVNFANELTVKVRIFRNLSSHRHLGGAPIIIISFDKGLGNDDHALENLDGSIFGDSDEEPNEALEMDREVEYRRRQFHSLMLEGLGLGGGEAVGTWNSENEKREVLLGIGGGHYAPRHMDIALKDNVWEGHLLSGYSLPMEDPKHGENYIGGTWRQSIKAIYAMVWECIGLRKKYILNEFDKKI